MDPEDQKNAPRGYLSEESKKKFTLAVGILGAVFFFGQMIVPFLFMVLFMPAFIFSNGFDFTLVQADRAATYEGKLWYLAKGAGLRTSGGDKVRLMSLEREATATPVEVAQLSIRDPWLLPAGDRLWIIGQEAVAWLKNGKVVCSAEGTQLGEISRPCLYEGSPAVVETGPDGPVLKSFTGEGWKTVRKLRLGSEKAIQSAGRNLQVVVRGDRVDLFLQMENTLYHHDGFPGEKDEAEAWKPVASVGSTWSAFWLGDSLVCFYNNVQRDASGTLTAVRLKDSVWEPAFQRRIPMMIQVGVTPSPEGGFIILSQGFPGSFRVIEAKDGAVRSERKFGSGFPFGGGFVALMMIPQVGMMVVPVILALVLSGLMNRHRVCDYGVGNEHLPYATLTRRALAQIIDGVLQMGPMALVIPFFLTGFDEMTSPFEFFQHFGLIALAMLAMGAVFLVFTFTEGSWGVTPGKWLFGIRVLGTDLKPCGFGRAFVRNLLKFADGFFNFMVGLLVSALSENWQRVGDMAARTVVVRVTPGYRPR